MSTQEYDLIITKDGCIGTPPVLQLRTGSDALINIDEPRLTLRDQIAKDMLTSLLKRFPLDHVEDNIDKAYEIADAFIKRMEANHACDNTNADSSDASTRPSS